MIPQPRPCRLCWPVLCRAVLFAPGAFWCETANWALGELGPRELHALATRLVARGQS